MGKRHRKELLVSEAHEEAMTDSDSEDDAGRKSFFGKSSSTKQEQPKNQQRVLLIASRGITHRYRHLMNDFHTIMPHSKKEAKLDSKSHLDDINEIAELTNCNNSMYFEMRKHSDMYLWMSKTPNGPSAKFLVRTVSTMDELKMTGNCLKGSRPVLSFDATFDSLPHYSLLKEMFVQTFSVPKTSRKIKPFIDHVMSFSILDNKVWIRHFQIVMEKEEMSLVEIGPRCVLDLIRLFDGSFGGSTLFENPHYISPNDVRRQVKEKIMVQKKARAQSQQQKESKMKLNAMEPDPLATVFE